MNYLRLIAVLGVVLMTGCSTTKIVVLDETKAPVADAEVEPITQSMNLAVLRTDASGTVKLPGTPQKIEWVSVKKEGFEPSGQIPVKEHELLTVVLKPVK